MSYVIQAVLSNPRRPECDQITIPFPIPVDQYDKTIEMLQAIDLGFSVNRDCTVDEVNSRYSVLNTLGRFLVDTAFITGKFRFPEEARPYLDYARIGAEQRDALGGIYTPHGLVKRREEAPVQEETPKAMLLTLTVSEQSYPLVLPASEKQLGQAKESLRIEDFAQAVIASAEYTAPYLNRLIPMDSITVEDANEMALCLQRLKKDGEIIKYCAALEVEEPSTFTEALDMAIDIDDYELISDSEREYGRQALRRMGANDEVLEAIGA